MELTRMTLVNYRRLAEKTVINFASGEKNVTIIRAQNGSGKTGILMALLFGLFGTVKYDQFQIENDDDVMVSSFAIEKNSQARCTVEVDFVDEDTGYTISRSILAQNINGIIKQDSNNVETKLFKGGIDTGWSKEKIDSFMNNLIGENIRGFLFFDGVKYTELFKQNNGKTKKELKNIIEKMLNINDLNAAISVLHSMASSLSEGSISSKLETKFSNAKNEVDKCQKEFDAKKEEVDAKDNYIKKLEDERAKALDKYKKYEEFEGIVLKINKNEKEIKALEDSTSGKLSSLNFLIKKTIHDNVYCTFGKDVKEEMEKYSLDLKGGLELINTIIESGRCICSDRMMTEQEKNNWIKYKHEIESRESFSPAFISKIKLDLNKIEESAADETLQSELANLIENWNKISSYRAENDSLYSQLPNDSEEGSISDEIIKAKANNEAHSIMIEHEKIELETLNSELLKKEILLKEANDKLSEVEKERALSTNQGKKYEFYKGAENKLINLRNNYLSEAQQNISNRANEFFIELLSENDKQLVSKLILDEDYSIKVYDKTQREIFGQLSAGQKLIASMAFVMGLTAEASNAKPTCNFPLVMDTPFSNLDSANRASLIRLMPSVVRQWVLTPMDTELTDAELHSFNETNRVGKIYELHKAGYKSKIVEFDDLLDLRGGIKNV
ncbi:MAG: AAA family ATPase [Bacilli bacterium]|nr:AAA family ATPase [Bacilli bacterium]